MRKKILFSLSLISAGIITGMIYAQTSIWRDHNPYNVQYVANDILMVKVNEHFTIAVKGEWGYTKESKRDWNPDTVNFEFLRKSNQNKTSSDKDSYSVKSNDSIKFDFPVKITQVLEGNLYQIEGIRQMNISEKPVIVRLNGTVSGRNIENYMVTSDKIVDLNISIVIKVPTKKDNSIQLKQTGEGEEAKTEAILSDSEKERYKLEQIREILGAL